MKKNLLQLLTELLCLIFPFLKICRSYESGPLGFKRTIDSTEAAVKYFLKIWDMDSFDDQESVYVLLMDHKNRLIKDLLLHKGSKHKCYIDEVSLLENAVKYHSMRIYIAHNHPSGSKKAYSRDISETAKVCESAKTIKRHIIDHIILTRKGHYSFLDNGHLD